MESGKRKVTDLKVAYIGGGSRAWAWKLMTDLALEPSMGGTMALYDIDIPAAEKNRIIGEKINDHPKAVSDWKYTVSYSLEEALEDADFVVISIQPGTFEEMRSDVHLPERLGIYQAVGDTVGPGGMIRALRTYPMYEEIALAIREHCPEAWVINYTNPMSLCVRFLYDIFPEIKAFGCCHEVFGTQEVLAGITSQALDIEHIPREEILVNVLGINHFTWFDHASYQDVDVFPLYRDYIKNHKEDGYTRPGRYWEDSPFNYANLVKFDLFETYGLIAAAGDRHLAEFMPGDTYLNDPETVTQWKFGLTTVDYREKRQDKRIAQRERWLDGTEELDMTPSGEEGVLLMKALLGLDRVVSVVNLPNMGQIENLPEVSVVETNAVFSHNSIHPLMQGEIPQTLVDMMLPHQLNTDYIMEAVKTFDKDLLVKAFLNDPLVNAKCTNPETLRELIDDMLANTSEYLPDEWL